VDDPEAVRVGEDLGGAPHEVDALAHGEARPREALSERLALDPLQREVGRAGFELAVRDEPHDARVGELGEQLGLALEPLGLLFGDLSVEDLERDRGARLQVGRSVHLRRAAHARAVLDAEALGDDEAWIHGRPRVSSIAARGERRAPRAGR
jgi:hypothetical protein